MRRPFPPYAQNERRARRESAASLNKAHGRIERRTLTTSTGLNDYLDWPGVQQVGRIDRARTIKGKTTNETAYFISSLPRKRADAKALLALSRRHWGAIENGLHHVRDETLGEDRSTIFKGDAPQNLAALRNAGLNLLRQLKIDNIASTLRSFARQPLRLFTIFGYQN